MRFFRLIGMVAIALAATRVQAAPVDAAAAFKHNADALAKLNRIEYDARLSMTSIRDLDTTPSVMETLEVGTVRQCGGYHASERTSATKDTTAGKLLASRRVIELVNEAAVMRVRYPAQPGKPVDRTPSLVEFQAQGLPIPAGKKVRRMADQGWSLHRLPFEIKGASPTNLVADPKLRAEAAPVADGQPVIVRIAKADSGTPLYDVTLDPAKGWLITNMIEFDTDGAVASEVATKVAEIAPGVWFPTSSTAVTFHMVRGQAQERARAVLDFSKIDIPQDCDPSQFAVERLHLDPDQPVRAISLDGQWEEVKASQLLTVKDPTAGT